MQRDKRIVVANAPTAGAACMGPSEHKENQTNTDSPTETGRTIHSVSSLVEYIQSPLSFIHVHVYEYDTTLLIPLIMMPVTSTG